MPLYEYDTDFIKLHWQIEALRGQVVELERDRERTGNLLAAVRFVLVRALRGMDVDADFGKMNDAEVLRLFERVTRDDWRFSRCPRAAEYKCRPSALHVTTDHEIIGCEDCGWDILENPLPKDTAATKDEPAKAG